ncbi:FHA domain-containing protein [Hydrogenimonas sp. SS33]|uniref:FHA domain-containing protein n=1 Tax=Hydrogenimonas leucolamina TaxID=2954236 RepID=UPI00336BC298
MESIDKKSIREAFLPKAVLVAQTKEAEAAIPVKNHRDDLIPIWHFPFRIGRESRVEIDEEGRVIVKERFRPEPIVPSTNDVYLVDFGEKYQISRKHLEIGEENGNYYVLDFGSHCGTSVNQTRIGNGAPADRAELKDGDTVVLGKEDSPYRYTFVLL